MRKNCTRFSVWAHTQKRIVRVRIWWRLTVRIVNFLITWNPCFFPSPNLAYDISYNVAYLIHYAIQPDGFALSQHMFPHLLGHVRQRRFRLNFDRAIQLAQQYENFPRIIKAKIDQDPDSDIVLRPLSSHSASSTIPKYSQNNYSHNRPRPKHRHCLTYPLP